MNKRKLTEDNSGSADIFKYQIVDECTTISVDSFERISQMEHTLNTYNGI